MANIITQDFQIFNVIYSFVECDDFQNPIVRATPFLTEAEAVLFLEKDYKETLESLKNGGTVYDILKKEHYVNSANIVLGCEPYHDGDDWETEAIHSWRVQKRTIKVSK